MPRAREAFEARVLRFFREGDAAAAGLLYRLVSAEVRARGLVTATKKKASKPRRVTTSATTEQQEPTLASVAMR